MMSLSSQKLILAVLMAVVVVATSSQVAPATSRVISEELETPNSFGITVVIGNTLERRQHLQVHCKDKGSDFGVHQVPYGTTYSFHFVPTLFSADYFCGFVFDNVLHWFDIYLWKRDYGRCTDNTCNWFVNEDGPCFSDPQTPSDCYHWNRN